jgi:UDP-N-acetylglucosamine 1-carboxyvinyltransferase
MPAIALAAALRARAELSNVPRIQDVEALLSMLDAMGARHEWRAPGELFLDATGISRTEAALPSSPADFRGAVYLSGVALTCGSGSADIRVGGDKIATRNLRPHLRAIRGFGHRAAVTVDGQLSIAPATAHRGAAFALDDKGVSASCLALTLAACATGRSRIERVSLEHEVSDFVRILRAQGVQVFRRHRDVSVRSDPDATRSRTLRIVIPSDVVVAGTAIVSALLRGESLHLRVVGHEERARWVADLCAVTGAPISHAGGDIHVRGGPRRGFNVRTGFPPFLPADLQPLFTVLALGCPGPSQIEDRVYGTGRFDLVPRLVGIGGRIERTGNTLRIAPSLLRGRAEGTRLGIREQAALRIAAAVHGVEIDGDFSSLWRGYERSTALTDHVFRWQ